MKKNNIETKLVINNITIEIVENKNHNKAEITKNIEKLVSKFISEGKIK